MLSKISWSDFGLYLFIALIIYYGFVFIKFWLPGMTAAKHDENKNIHIKPEERQAGEEEEFNESDLNSFLRKKIVNTTEEKKEIIDSNFNNNQYLSTNIDKSNNTGLDKNEKVNELEPLDEDFFPEDEYINADELDNRADSFILEGKENPEGNQIEDLKGEKEETSEIDAEPSKDIPSGQSEEETNEQTNKNTFNIDFTKFLD